MTERTMNITLQVWRQDGPSKPGKFERYEAKDVSEHSSFLEMLDLINEGLIKEGKDPFSFDHDCREGICGMCGMVINGIPHGPQAATTTCQLHMRKFKSGDELWLEPWRAAGFPVVKDLVVDRAAFDRIIQAGGYITSRTGSAPEANGIAIDKKTADAAFDAAACIGCGACVAACPNASAMLFVSAKATHLGLLPQGQPERKDRARTMVAQADAEGFGGCTNHRECEAACPKEIKFANIARLNRDFIGAMITSSDDVQKPQPTR